MDKKLTVALCTDKRGAMLFGGKRVSSDRLLIKDLCQSVSGKIAITEYSTLLFKEYTDRTVVCQNPLKSGLEVAFVEDPRILRFEEIDELIIYDFGRVYPYDVGLEYPLDGYTLLSESEFQGKSHEKITKRIYRKSKQPINLSLSH